MPNEPEGDAKKEELLAKIERVKEGRGRVGTLAWIAGIALLAALGGGALTVIFLSDSPFSQGGWALGGGEVEARFTDYLEGKRFSRARESIALIKEREGESVRTQRMTLALARAFLAEEAYDEAYALVSELSLVDKSDRVMIEILRVKFGAQRPFFFTEDGDLRAPYNLPCYDTEFNTTLELDSRPPKTPGGKKAEQARRFVEDLEDAEALMEERPKVREAFQDMTDLKELVRWAWDLVDEEDFRETLGEPADLPLPVRYQFANLLFRERRYEEAISLFRPIIEGVEGEKEAEKAFAHLARFYALHKALEKAIPFWDYRLGNFMEACLAEPEFKAIHERIQGRVEEVIPPGALEEDWVLEELIERDVFEKGEIPIESDELILVNESTSLERFEQETEREETSQLFLQTDHREFILTNPASRPLHSKGGGRLKLLSLYRGVIRLHLYRFPNYPVYSAFEVEKAFAGLQGAKRIKTWSEDLGRLSENGRKGMEYWIPLPGVEAGYYAVLAEARYCPIFSGVKLIVSDLMLAVRAGKDSLLAYVTDRRSGEPAAGVRLKGHLEVEYNFHSLWKSPLEKNRDPEFEKGLKDATIFFGTAKEPSAAKQEELRRASPEFREGWEAGRALRKTYPPLAVCNEGVTDEKGVWILDVPPAMHEHAYKAKVTSADPWMCFWSSVTTKEDWHKKRLKTLFYPDRPLYRPGDEVHFKGIVRDFDGENYYLPGPKPVAVEIRLGDTTVFSASLHPDDVGCVAGDFKLSEDASLGAYKVHVNGGKGRTVFKVRHYQKPDMEIRLETERSIFTAGETVQARMHVTTLAGEHRPGAKVKVQIRRIPMDLEHRVAFRLPGEPQNPDPLDRAGKTIFSKNLIADAQGSLTVPFKTSPGVEAVYRIRASVTEGKVIHGAQTLVEARAVPVRLTVVSDRAAYRPQDTLRLNVTSRDLRGRPVAWSLRLRELPRKTKKKEENPPHYEPLSWDFDTEEDGSGEIAVPVREGCGGYVLGVRYQGDWHDRDVPVTLIHRNGPAKKTMVQPDREVYLPGESMKVSLRLPRGAGFALLTGETDRILFHRVVEVSKSGVEVSVPIRAEYGPNFFLALTTVGHDNVIHVCSKAIRVVPVDKFLTLSIATDKSEYRPGETCHASVTVSDYYGKPCAGASVSIGVVDVALYKLETDRTPDLWTYFYSHRVPHRIEYAWFNDTFSFEEFFIWKSPIFGWGKYEFRGKYWNSASGAGEACVPMGGADISTAPAFGGGSGTWPSGGRISAPTRTGSSASPSRSPTRSRAFGSPPGE
jgi:hypothetical protein